MIEGELDLAISYFSRSRPSLEYRPLYREEIGVFCGDRHPLFAEAQPTLERIAACDWVCTAFCRKTWSCRYARRAAAPSPTTWKRSPMPCWPAPTWATCRPITPKPGSSVGGCARCCRSGLSYPVEHSMIVHAGRPLSEAARAFIDDLLQVHGLGS